MRLSIELGRVTGLVPVGVVLTTGPGPFLKLKLVTLMALPFSAQWIWYENNIGGGWLDKSRTKPVGIPGQREGGTERCTLQYPLYRRKMASPLKSVKLYTTACAD